MKDLLSIFSSRFHQLCLTPQNSCISILYQEGLMCQMSLKRLDNNIPIPLDNREETVCQMCQKCGPYVVRLIDKMREKGEDFGQSAKMSGI